MVFLQKIPGRYFYKKILKMKVLKFGGTSIGNANQIKKVVNIISESENKIVVFSAIQDITNLLSDFIKQSQIGNWIIQEQILAIVNETHLSIINELILNAKFKEIAIKKLEDSIHLISKYINKKISEKEEKNILAQGELLSSMIIYIYLLEQGIDAALIPAVKYIRVNKHQDPDLNYIRVRLNNELEKHKGCKLFITQGFICTNHKNKIDNLGRGGSDYTATIIGNAINAHKIEIWTDIDGLQNNDPRFVENTQSIDYLSYEGACELAYFGAKILHPASIKPAQFKNIPVIVKNTLNPENSGTTISDYKNDNRLKAIAAKDGITTIRIKSGRMMQAYGFLRKIFEVFENYQTSVDMLTTSEVSVAMTIENTVHLAEIVDDLSKLGETQVEKNQCIICVVGNNNENKNISLKNIIEGLCSIPIKMLSFGASSINVSLVIDSENKVNTLNLLNQSILKNELCLAEQE